jgi:hypothetical protein
LSRLFTSASTCRPATSRPRRRIPERVRSG